ncbi:hypothetical protein RND71_005134 [Anisodus tanguticus]|uniref:histidine kinase n=1 Tax=Anisodus tanguticus TaxID=243964 RepID=A0AAE1SQX8_9SOLA|nr:hypothetical protein RND71_005134 [Anisodus tanguticus]
MYLCAALIKQMEATHQAERKSMNKSTAFVLASHDIRASLAGISGLIDMCRALSSQESESVKYLNHMESCTNDLLVNTFGFDSCGASLSMLLPRQYVGVDEAILNSILDQSKIEEGKIQLKEEEFNMEELLEHVVNIYHPNGAMKKVDVLLDPCDGSIARFYRVKGDRGELRRILSNLLHNAVKFTSEGRVTLRAWARKPQSSNFAPNTSNISTGWMSCLYLQNDESSAEVQVVKKAQQDPNCVEFIFEVDDTGKGIPKEKQKSVFENYVQENDQTASIHGSQAGTGLGLGITQSLVRLMGGEIGIVDKKIGEKGTCFRFNIFLIASDHPRDQEHQPLHGSSLCRVLEFVPEFEGTNLATATQEIKDETTTSTIKIQQPPIVQDVSVDMKLPLTGQRILVVEDNKVLLMMCKAKVSKLGATTSTCENGEEALDLVRKGLSDQRDIGPSTPSPPFEYILMDCQMPKMDGFEATKCLREEEARYGIRIPIIALTAHTEEEKDKIFQVGMDYYLPKPLKPDLLLKTIDYIEHRNV